MSTHKIMFQGLLFSFDLGLKQLYTMATPTMMYETLLEYMAFIRQTRRDDFYALRKNIKFEKWRIHETQPIVYESILFNIYVQINHLHEQIEKIQQYSFK